MANGHLGGIADCPAGSLWITRVIGLDMHGDVRNNTKHEIETEAVVCVLALCIVGCCLAVAVANCCTVAGCWQLAAPWVLLSVVDVSASGERRAGLGLAGRRPPASPVAGGSPVGGRRSEVSAALLF
jgi:hypothetical protein